MTGPPTPPLSSALEIQDAARGSVPPEAAVPAIAPEPEAQALPVAPVPQHPTLPQQESRYGLVFPALSDLAANGRYEELVQTAEEIDLIVNVFALPSLMRPRDSTQYISPRTQLTLTAS